MIIKSINNQRIKDVKTLYRKKNRMNKKLFLIEGTKIIEEALEMDYPLKEIFYTDGLKEIREGDRLYNKVSKMNNSIKVSEKVFEEISDTETPQGIIGVAKLFFRDFKDIFKVKGSRYILLDGLQDPGNMGTIIRSADAFNLDGIIIKSGTVDPYNPKVVRATMGSIFRMPIYYLNDILDIDRLKDDGFRILSTRLENARDISLLDFEKTIVIIGNESQGVSEDIFKLTDEFIKIPMPGESESLNAGVAASIIMYESIK